MPIKRYLLPLLLALLLPLSAQAENPEEIRLQAMSLAQQDQLIEADEKLRALLETQPEDADVLFSAAQVAHWLGQDQRALEYLDRAQAEAPDYGDLYRLELQILARAASTREDRRDYALRYQAVAADQPLVTSDLPSSLAPPRGNGWVEAGLFGSFLTGDLDNSLGEYIAGSWTEVGGRTWYGELNHASRFGLDDVELWAGVYQPIRRSHRLHLNASVSPTRRVRPDYSLYAGWYFSPAQNWGLEPGLRLTQYRLDNAMTYSLMIERYIQRWRLAYTPAWVRLDGDNHALSHSVQATRSYGRYNHIGVGLATGRDLERIPNRVVVTRVNSLSLNGMHFFRPRLAVTYRLGLNQLVDRYDRYDWRIGVRYTF